MTRACFFKSAFAAIAAWFAPSGSSGMTGSQAPTGSFATGCVGPIGEHPRCTQSFAASDWARDFVQQVRLNPSIATDEGTVCGWFANAIMRGYDERERILNAEAREAGQILVERLETISIRGAVARGWCSEENSHKEMDCVLAEAITQEILKLSPNEKFQQTVYPPAHVVPGKILCEGREVELISARVAMSEMKPTPRDGWARQPVGVIAFDRGGHYYWFDSVKPYSEWEKIA